MDRTLIFEKGKKGRVTNYVPSPDIPMQSADRLLPRECLRQDVLKLPSLGELEVVRHYTNLSRLNFSVDTNFYPLGSCTMKYNPKINEYAAGLSGFTDIHPYQDEVLVQGALALIYDLEKILCEITGMKRLPFRLQAERKES